MRAFAREPGRHSARHARQSRRHAPIYWLGVLLAVLFLGTGAAILGHLAFFTWRSHTVGEALVHHESALIAAAKHSSGGSAAAHLTAFTYGGHVLCGLLEIPRIGLTAPVLAGASDATLSVAVGHVSQSAWPNEPGTAIFAAHDVTWFAHITRLRRGDIVRYVTPSTVFTYRVTTAAIVSSHAQLQTAPHRLILDTCYPLDALYFTGQRYLVSADFLSSQALAAPATRSPPRFFAPPRLDLPAVLVRQGITLQTNPIPVGTLSLAGSPSASYAQSSAPLAAATVAHELFFAALHAAEQDNVVWWHYVAPESSLAAVAPLSGARLSSIQAPLETVLTVKGEHLVGVTLTLRAEVAGGQVPGFYNISLRETAQAGILRLTRWSMTVW
jgi:sortase A